MQTFYDQTFEQKTSLAEAEYENCVFRSCSLSNSTLARSLFNNCRFEQCDLSLLRLEGTALREVLFRECKLLGVSFDTTNDFGRLFEFDTCHMDHCSFYRMKIKKTRFQHCRLWGADFTETDLSEAVFSDCDLQGAVFDRSILEKADFRTASNYSIHPERNKIKNACFSIQGLPGLLDAYQLQIVL